MKQPLLEVDNLQVGYGEIQVLHGLSIHLNENERIGLFGPNGHGKTTLLRTISGLLKPWDGEVRFTGQTISGKTAQDIVDLGIIHVPQGNTLFPRMTVMENLLLGAYSRRTWNHRWENQERVFDLFPALTERKDQLCRTLSGGERQMLSIGVGIMGEAHVLILDEPTLGLAPKLKEHLCEAISRIADGGVPLIIVEQDVEFLLTLTDRLYLVEGGQVVFEKTKESEILEHEQIMEMYFGKTGSAELAAINERGLA